jgi:hypothetical protein
MFSAHFRLANTEMSFRRMTAAHRTLTRVKIAEDPASIECATGFSSPLHPCHHGQHDGCQEWINQSADAQQVDPGPTNMHRSCAMLQTEGLSRQAVWAEEAMHRAASLQHLAIDLERLLDSGNIDWNNRLRTIRRAKALMGRVSEP